MIPGEFVGENYEIIKKIGEGSFGFVYKVRHKTTHELYAIKTDEKSLTKNELENEVAILQKIQKRLAKSQQTSKKAKIPINICLGSFFSESSPNKMLISLHGENLMNLFQKCNGRFDSHTIYEVSKAMLKSIEFIHNVGFIHRDIKPQNFVAGRGYDDHHKESIDDGIYLVDFGLSKEYLSINQQKSSNQHVKYEINRKIRGTLMYMSINVMLGIEPSRRDDLESFMYILLLFLKGRLPWHNLNVTKKNFDQLTMAKISIHPDDLFVGMPNELKNAFIYIRKLKFEETPNYKKIMDTLESILSFKNPKIQEEYSGKYRTYCWQAVYEKENIKELSENVTEYMKKKQYATGSNREKEYTLMPQ